MILYMSGTVMMYDHVIMDICHYTFVSGKKCATPRVSLKETMELGWLGCVGVGSSVVHCALFLVGNVDNKELVCGWWRGYGSFLTFLSMLLRILTTLKNKKKSLNVKKTN